ncbi:MAG TPA: hypothetical protein VGU02_08980 [Gaiellaceae bacterium]|nr:hypothetical protein [Gaiellaceae bacterium]
MGEADGFDLSAASLRAAAGDLKSFVPVLADKLESALPGRVRVERRRAGFLSGAKVVSRVECGLGDRQYRLEQSGGSWHASKSTVVRGVALKSETLPVEQWLDALLADLRVEAQSSEESSRALGRLLAG